MSENNRYQEMLALYESGMTFEEVGYAFNVTRQRVHQIIGSQHQKRSTGFIQKQILEILRRCNDWVTVRDIAGGHANAPYYVALNALVKKGIVERRISARSFQPNVYRLKSED